MEYRTMFLERLDGSGLAAPCDLQRSAIVAQAEELLNRAIANGLATEGAPFVQLCGPFIAFVNLPVATGQNAENAAVCRIAGSWVAVTPGVNFEEARAVSREVGTAMAGEWAFNGPAEFHPEGPDFERGSLVLPVTPVAKSSPLPALLSPRLLVTAIPGA